MKRWENFPPADFLKLHLHKQKVASLSRKIKVFTSLVIIILLLLQISGGLSYLKGSQAAGTRDYSANAVIYGGTWSVSELNTRINSGTDGVHNDLKTIFLTLGIYPSEFSSNGNIDGAYRQTLDGYVTRDGRVVLDNGQTVASSNIIVCGRSYMAGSVADVFGLPLWWRSPAVSFRVDKISAFIHLVNGKFSYAILKSDSSPVKTWGTPQISLTKYVRNVSRGTSWSTGTIKAKRGEIIEYKNVYQVGSESLTNVWLYDTLRGNTGNGQKSSREQLSDPYDLTPQWIHYYPSGISTPTGYRDQRMLAWQAPGRAPQTAGAAAYKVKIKYNTPAGTIIRNDSAIYADRVGVVLSNIVNVEIEESVDYWQVSNPGNQTAGKPFNVTVAPKNADGTTIESYQWNVASYRPTLSGLNNSPSGKAPTYTFVSAKNGIATYEVTSYAAQTNVQIKATGGASPEATGLNSQPFTVFHATASRIDIAPGEQTTTAGNSIIYTSSAFDAYANSWDVSAQTSFSILEPGHEGTWRGNCYTAKKAGNWTVQGVYAGFSDNALLRVNHAAATLLDIRPDTASVTAGQSITYTATATDAYTNSWEVTSETRFSITNGAGGSWAGNVYTSEKAGNWIVTGTYDSVSDQASLRVEPSFLDHFVLSDIANQVAGNPFNIFVIPYDQYNNLISDYNWEDPGNRPLFSGLASSPGGFDPEYSYQSAHEGIATYQITPYAAENNVRINVVLNNATGSSNTFNVGHAAAVSIDLIPDPWTVTAGETVTYTSQASDPYGNTWDATTETNFAIDAGAHGSWAANVYTSETAGTWTVTATYAPNPAIFDTATLNVTPGPAAYLTVTNIANPATAGNPSDVTVTAYDQFGNISTGYTGTIHFTSNDPYPATLPADYTFVPGDHGTHTFTAGVTLYTAGSRTVTATDINNPTITGSQTVDVNPGPTTTVTISPAPTATVTAGENLQFSAEARDQYGNLITDRETDFTWQGTDATGLFHETRAGTCNVNATYQGITSPDTQVTVNPASLDHVVISPDDVTLPVDGTQAYTVDSYDQYNNLITSGLIYDWSATTGGTMNNNTIQSPTYTAGHTVGDFTIAVTVTEGSIERQDTAAVHITPGPVDHFVFNPISSPQTAGTPFGITIIACDRYGNTDTNFTGTADLSDLTGTINPVVTGNFIAGVWTGNVTITQARVGDTITATRTGGTETGTSNPFDVDHAAAISITLTPDPWTVTAGETVTYTVQASDPYGNTWDATTETNFTIDAGAHGSWAANVYTSETAGTWTVTATYAPNPAIFDTATLNVTPGPAAYLRVTGISNPSTAGNPSDVTVTAYDQFGNISTGYTGTIHFTSNDPYPATLPADYTFVPGDNGTHTFTAGVTLYTAGSRTVTVTDTNNPTITGSQTVDVNPGPTTTVTISPAPTATVTAGENLQFSAEARDQYGNLITDTETDFTWQGTDATGLFHETRAGIYNVNATYQGITSADTLVTVNPGPTAQVIINPDSPQTIVAGETITFTAVAQDQYGNPNGDSIIWVGTSAPDSGLFNNTQAGDYEVYAVASGIESIHVPVTVVPNVLDHIVMLPSESPRIIIAGQTIQFSAQGYDRYNNPLSGLIYTWFATTQTGLFNNVAAGSYDVHVEVIGTPTVDSNHVTVIVNPASVFRVTISPAPTATVTAGENLQFSAEARDQYGNLITDRETDFTWFGTNPAGLFNQTVPGTYIVHASYYNVVSPDTTVTVNPLPSLPSAPSAAVAGAEIGRGTSIGPEPGVLSAQTKEKESPRSSEISKVPSPSSAGGYPSESKSDWLYGLYLLLIGLASIAALTIFLAFYTGIIKPPPATKSRRKNKKK